MKLAVFNDFRIGVVAGHVLRDVTGVLPSELNLVPAQRMNWLIAHWTDYEAPIRDRGADDSVMASAIDDVTLLAPVPAPPHIFAAPANYRKHLHELGARSVSKGRTAREQGFFLKAPGSIIGPGARIELPRNSLRRFDHESELAVIVGQGGRNIHRDDAMKHVFGYSCLIDGTMRIEPGSGEEERTMRKSFASFTPLGPYLVTADEVPEPHALRNRLSVNGEVRQDANTADMIVGIAELIELVSSVLPLSPGDVIATGTPEGVGPLTVGDEVSIEIDRIGQMSLRVHSADVVSPRPF
ncbi:fumarylacetoacetate hydrolase family protein [Chitinasiproducens palmae]|uniref:2-keto-4-pentenoate hydratase/2-oxohepta-3-ene-1,7-dioic acid hydratase (Catechol pathway) n=1 Tax=Chitinasiproducens palmae TaxID=1770053 RepID=A0A1H2PL93_9BURK|nr:fumarylacetoacetate hydrolase family protein [Chitinasiproducens palmae]SDV47170.1 2-keto-4-pentenoate hydratase/2-oxohepta-3-ene-1,7-dioic acid hydratase (catechol pathway) [Chitinasiproducens palmae]